MISFLKRMLCTEKRQYQIEIDVGDDDILVVLLKRPMTQDAIKYFRSRLINAIDQKPKVLIIDDCADIEFRVIKGIRRQWSEQQGEQL